MNINSRQPSPSQRKSQELVVKSHQLDGLSIHNGELMLILKNFPEKEALSLDGNVEICVNISITYCLLPSQEKQWEAECRRLETELENEMKQRKKENSYYQMKIFDLEEQCAQARSVAYCSDDGEIRSLEDDLAQWEEQGYL